MRRNPDRWTRPSCATAELRRRGCEGVCLIGLRFGATLAAKFAIDVVDKRNAPDALVLWEPIVNGKDYVQELADMHRRELQIDPAQEMLGFAFPTPTAPGPAMWLSSSSI